MAKGPQYSDPADGIHLVRVIVLFGCPCFIILTAAWSFLYAKDLISGPVFVVLLLLTLPLTIAAIFAVHRSVGSLAVGVVHTIYAVGDIPPPPTYPRQDVLIVRGKYAEAADCFRDHLRIEPADHEARLRLAQLLETHLKSYDEAESLYLEIRRGIPPPDPNQQMRAANGLIDLYRKMGKTDRLKVELARLADRYPGSALGDGAARELSKLKATSE